MSKKRYQVLVVEDEPIIQMDTVNEIEDANLGFEVKWTAYNGEDALEIIETERPDVVFTDIKMPIMSGIELARHIREKDKDIPIVFLTSFSEFDYARQAVQFKVEEYLLKPLESEQLQEVLGRILEKLEHTREKEEREILFSKVHGIEEEHSLPFQFKEEEIALYLIQVGNQYHYDFSEEMLETVKQVWKKIEWEQWIQEICGSKKYWVIDEKTPNQKFLLIMHGKHSILNKKENFTERFGQKFREKLIGIPLHVAVCDKKISYQEIWTYSGKLRMLIKNAKVGSEILTLGEKMQSMDRTFMNSWRKRLKVDIENQNLSGIRQEFTEYLQYAEKNCFSQLQIEQDMITVYESMMENQRQDWEQAENEFLLEIRKENFQQESIQAEQSWNFIEEKYRNGNIIEDPTVSMKEIEDYIKKHYVENITVEQLAKKFHFHRSYLTRVFKKHAGESPINYLTQVRLEKAIELMKEREDLDIQSISNMVGYEDSHYFSRVFKNKLGKSPSEYRREV